MKRIEPTHFIEVYRGRYTSNQEDGKKVNNNAIIEDIKNLQNSLYYTLNENTMRTIAVFLIQPQTTSLAERMERRNSQTYQR